MPLWGIRLIKLALMPRKGRGIYLENNFLSLFWALVYYEIHDDVREAMTREKQIKKWNRSWKLRLIEEKNPEWRDLYNEMVV